MHELAVTESIWRIVNERAEAAGAERVTSIHLVIGEMSGFIPDSIQFYFDHLTENTVAEGATLSFTRVPIRLKCWECGREYQPEDRCWICPDCGASGGKTIAGKEFYVEGMVIE